MSDLVGGGRSWRRRRRWRLGLVAAAVIVVVALSTAAALGMGGGGDGGAERTGAAAAVSTVPVMRETLIDAVSVEGAIGFGQATPMAPKMAGVVTWLPAVGTVVRRGGFLARVNDSPVVLFYGTLPAYRALAEPMTGKDVKELEANLAALGYAGFTVDETFSSATTAAVKRWQRDLGLEQTGTVELGRVYVGSGPVRVAGQLVRLGADAATDVIATTGTTRVVTISVPEEASTWATAGAKVTVIFPDGHDTDGVVASNPTPATQQAGGQVERADTPMVDVLVTVADQQALASAQRGTVVVRHVITEHRDVLTVPVSALVALAEGGYGLEVIENGSSRFVEVQIGLFADGKVEVSGTAIEAGTVVRVPS